MVKCPKCGTKDYYTPLATLDRDFDGDRMIELNEVKCDECNHYFVVKDVFKIKYDYSTNAII